MKKSLRTVGVALTAAAGTLALASAAHATLIAAEPFIFANGSGALSASGNSNDNSSQWGDAWVSAGSYDGTYYAGSLSAPASATAYAYTPSGNSVLTPTNLGGSVNDQRNFSSALSGAVWVSFLIQPQIVSGRLQGMSLFTGTGNGGTDLIDIGSDGESNSAGPGGGWQTANQTAAVDLTPNWGINGTGASSAIVNSNDATPVALDTTAVLVAEINLSAGTAYLWVNPTSSTDFTNTADTTNGPYESVTGLGTSSTLASLRIFAGSNISNYGGQAEDIYDEIRIGTTYADVVPEPVSLGLFGAIGALALLRRRRASAV